MRVFIRKNPDGDFPSVNLAVAAHGFKELGCEVIYHTQVADIDPTVEDVVVDYVDQSREILTRLGRSYPEICYPEELKGYLGRNVWETTVDTLSTDPDSWPVFIKPKGLKTFTGRLVKSLTDFRGTRLPDQDTLVWASEPVEFVAEWRVFFRYGKIIGIRQYKGPWYHFPDTVQIIWAFQAYKASYPVFGGSLDFGLTLDDRTLLVEANEGYSLGAYGLPPVNYAKLLAARWSQLMGVEDPFRDLKDFE